MSNTLSYDSFYDCEIQNYDNNNELDTRIINIEEQNIYHFERRQFFIRLTILFFLMTISFLIYIYYGKIDAFFIKIQNNI